MKPFSPEMAKIIDDTYRSLQSQQKSDLLSIEDLKTAIIAGFDQCFLAMSKTYIPKDQVSGMIDEAVKKKLEAVNDLLRQIK
jgi:hypothetical protein